MRIKYFILLLFVFMIGYTINVEDDRYNKISNDKLEQFENNIIIEGNDYENRSIDSNIFNKVGNKIENVIDKGFSIIFEVIKGIAND